MDYFAILFMDIKGYSQLPPDDKEKVHIALSDFEISVRNLRPVKGEPNCSTPLHYFNTWGDAIIALFNTAQHAMRGVKDLKYTFDKLNSNLRNNSLLIRVVLHWGKVYRLKSGSFFGDEIITAARIEPLVEPGEVWITEEFKAEIEKKTQSINQLDDGGLYLLPKAWGIRKIFRMGINDEIKKQDDNTTYVKVNFKWENNVVLMNPIEERDMSTNPLSNNDRASLIKNMQSFLLDKTISINTYCAIGIQNFLELDGSLCVGVRMKTKINKELPGYKLIATQCFNTGYKLIQRINNFPKSASALQNLFERTQQQPGQELSGTHIAEIEKKGIPVYEINVGESRCYGLIFINYSHVCPRLEIGICQVYKAVMGDENVLKNFGSDKYGMAEGTYCLWVREGKIKAFSFYSIRGFDGENILLRNTLSNVNNTPVVSDELLDPKSALMELLSSPARAVLERL